jgi:hypothetical protein
MVYHGMRPWIKSHVRKFNIKGSPLGFDRLFLVSAHVSRPDTSQSQIPSEALERHHTLTNTTLSLSQGQTQRLNNPVHSDADSVFEHE